MSCTSRECSWSCAFPAVRGQRTRHSSSSWRWRPFLRWWLTTISSRSCWFMCRQRLSRGVVDRWMSSNQLKLNTDETDFILLGTRQQIEKGNFHYITRWHRRSFINYRDMPGSPHRQRADVHSSHQALDRKVLLPASSAAHCPSRPISWGCMDARPHVRHQPRGLW